MTARSPEPCVMHSRPNPSPNSPFQEWRIQPVREYSDYNGDTFWETCTDEQSLDYDNPDAVGPVMFGVYLSATAGPRKGEWMSVKDFNTYEDAVEFLDSVTGPECGTPAVAVKDLVVALERAVEALNVAKRFRVGATDSYAIAALCDKAIAKAEGRK